ncbi:peptidoglycan editing factor PgeF [Calothrix sp. 336/3]|uniref:peptidoglycan editing factor PgeF n=1 Tax=Calothrix sp. 336/3 TaxID=1337936 RepID=UPI0004E30749|nr:peptidoglycan editing factor PgeF [Calothrix sp. 336/3]AKG23915.1 laccase [Calothrix sp. 336/3]
MLHTWQWQNWEGMPYLTCSILEDFTHGFFTQQFWLRPPEELTKILHPEALGYRLKQVHGNTVLTPREITNLLANSENSENTEEVKLAEGDGLMSETSLQAVWVASADCTPALIGDIVTGQVAAVHAGWRGTARKIIPQAIHRLLTTGSKLENLRIALGPAIAPEVYQVSTQTALEVGASIIPQDDANLLLAALESLPDSPILPDPHPDRLRLDVRRVNALQMEGLGISQEQIAIAPYCTFQSPEYFFSYRREKLKKVQWSGIVSR